MKVLVMVDVQREYIAEGRPFKIDSIAESLENCRRLLDHARRHHWPIIHIRHLQEGKIFTRNSEHSDFIEGFMPLANETEIAKSDFSCYSSCEFASLMREHQENEIVIAGYGSTMCCLSTIIEGYHRKQRIQYVRDASNAKKTARFGEQDLHERAIDILSPFCKIVETKQIVDVVGAAVPA